MGDVAERLQPRPPGALLPGSRVEVRKRFDASWARGFEVVDRTERGYRVRRLSDGAELPADFSGDDLRPEKHRSNDMWWY
jgi:hypothetical protein